MGRPMFAGKYLLDARPNVSSKRLTRKSQLTSLKNAQQDAARETEMLFQLADANADWKLTFDEFRNLMEARMGLSLIHI